MRFQVPDDCYLLTRIDIITNCGCGLLGNYFGDSPELFVRDMMPEIKWVEWNFRAKKWEDVENHKRYFEWLSEVLGVRKKEDWLNVTYADVGRLHGLSLIESYYGGKLNDFLATFVEEFEDMVKSFPDVQKWMGDVIVELIPGRCGIK